MAEDRVTRPREGRSSSSVVWQRALTAGPFDPASHNSTPRNCFISVKSRCRVSHVLALLIVSVEDSLTYQF